MYGVFVYREMIVYIIQQEIASCFVNCRHLCSLQVHMMSLKLEDFYQHAELI